MASIQLRNFGGMAPSANPQALAESQATFVQNLDLRFADFRPLPSPAFVSAAASGQSLYRFESTGTFITRPGQVSFVRGPIPNDATERTYYSGDGVPKVVDNTGAVRQLGVPQPAAAPIVTLNALPQFSEDDAKAARLNKFAEVMDAVRAHISAPYFGLTVADVGNRFDIDTGDQTNYLLRIPGAMSAQGNFIPTNPSHYNLNEVRLGFQLSAVTPNIAYSSLVMRAQGMEIGNGMAASLSGITVPNGSLPLIAPDMAAGIVSTLKEAIKAADKNRDEAIERMKTKVAQYLKLVDSGDPGGPAARGEVEAYFARPDIAGVIGAGITQAVSEIIGGMKAYTGGNSTTIPITGKPGAPDYYENPM